MTKQSKWTGRPDATTVTVSQTHYACFTASFVPLVYQVIYEEGIIFPTKN